MQEPFNSSGISKLSKVYNESDRNAFNEVVSAAADIIVMSLRKTKGSAQDQEDLDSLVSFLAAIAIHSFYLSDLERLIRISRKGGRALVTRKRSRQCWAIPTTLMARNCTGVACAYLLER